MKIALSLLVVLFISGCSDESYSLKDWNPDSAEKDVATQFSKTGYSPITVVGENGDQFRGENRLPQETIFCAMKDADMTLFVHRVNSLQEENIRNYVSIHNSTMLELLAKQRGCIR